MFQWFQAKYLGFIDVIYLDRKRKFLHGYKNSKKIYLEQRYEKAYKKDTHKVVFGLNTGKYGPEKTPYITHCIVS